MWPGSQPPLGPQEGGAVHHIFQAGKLGLKSERRGLSLVVWWIRICLPKQQTQVRSLVWEDPTCCEATKAA